VEDQRTARLDHVLPTVSFPPDGGIAVLNHHGGAKTVFFEIDLM
jgi:hypothetical protein